MVFVSLCDACVCELMSCVCEFMSCVCDFMGGVCELMPLASQSLRYPVMHLRKQYKY